MTKEDKRKEFFEDEEKDFDIEDPEKSDIIIHEKYAKEKKAKK